MTKRKIQLQTEAAELFFKEIKIRLIEIFKQSIKIISKMFIHALAMISLLHYQYLQQQYYVNHLDWLLFWKTSNTAPFRITKKYNKTSMNIKYQYTLGTEINLRDEIAFKDFVNTQGIFEEDFEIARLTDIGNLKLQYKDNNLIHIQDFNELNDYEKILNDSAKSFKYFGYQKHRINYLIKTKQKTHSYLGEDNSSDFILPTSKKIDVPFQNIGKLSKKDKVFNWLPFENFYITYPLFSGIIGYLFLDYSNSLQPIALDTNYLIEYPFGKIDKQGIHKFHKNYLSIKSIRDVKDKEDLVFDYWYIGVTGVPFWIQFPEIPRCPVTGRLMKFVCQLNSSDEILVKESSLISNKNYFESANKDLKFGGSGTLFIFMEPVSKIVGLVIQDT